jgi:hypothetical protein
VLERSGQREEVSPKALVVASAPVVVDVGGGEDPREVNLDVRPGAGDQRPPEWQATRCCLVAGHLDGTEGLLPVGLWVTLEAADVSKYPIVQSSAPSTMTQ